LFFDKRSQKWVNKFGICHTCTPKNGFRKDGTIETLNKITYQEVLP
jgi:hypothetical protein